MKQYFILIFCIFSALTAFSQNMTAETADTSSDSNILTQNDKQTLWQKHLRPNHIVDITVEPGLGIYIGSFYKTLQFVFFV